MRKRLVWILIVVALVVAALGVTALAHSGRTDANGGHWNHSTGEYHYHHGMSAHQHPNGVCPYDDNATEDTNNTAGSADKQDDWGSRYLELRKERLQEEAKNNSSADNKAVNKGSESNAVLYRNDETDSGDPKEREGLSSSSAVWKMLAALIVAIPFIRVIVAIFVTILGWFVNASPAECKKDLIDLVKLVLFIFIPASASALLLYRGGAATTIDKIVAVCLVVQIIVAWTTIFKNDD